MKGTRSPNNKTRRKGGEETMGDGGKGGAMSRTAIDAHDREAWEPLVMGPPPLPHLTDRCRGERTDVGIGNVAKTTEWRGDNTSEVV